MMEQPQDPATRTGGAEPNIVDLLGRLTQQGAHLAKDQVSLMQAEVREATQDIKAAIGAFAGAAVLGIAGLGVLLMGIAYFVAQALDNLALGTTIVGVATLIIAGILYAGAKKKVSATNLKPERTLDTIEDTAAAATGNMHNSGGRP
jgi:uncharacterized membrane protein